MKILWLASAQRDLNDLVDYIAEDNPRSSFETLESIKSSIHKLTLYPFAGREGRVAGTRELIIPQLPYIVVYTIVKEIRILALFHTSRKWPTAF